MTTPLTSSKVLLLPEARSGAETGAETSVRRYRIARLRFQPPTRSGAERFDYLKRSFD